MSPVELALAVAAATGVLAFFAVALARRGRATFIEPGGMLLRYTGRLRGFALVTAVLASAFFAALLAAKGA
jgi:hypothetical protein